MKKKLTLKVLFRYTKAVIRDRFLFICLYTSLMLAGLNSFDIVRGDIGAILYMTSVMMAPIFLGVAVMLGVIRADRDGY